MSEQIYTELLRGRYARYAPRPAVVRALYDTLFADTNDTTISLDMFTAYVPVLDNIEQQSFKDLLEAICLSLITKATSIPEKLPYRPFVLRVPSVWSKAQALEILHTQMYELSEGEYGVEIKSTKNSINNTLDMIRILQLRGFHQDDFNLIVARLHKIKNDIISRTTYDEKLIQSTRTYIDSLGKINATRLSSISNVIRNSRLSATIWNRNAAFQTNTYITDGNLLIWKNALTEQIPDHYFLCSQDTTETEATINRLMKHLSLFKAEARFVGCFPFEDSVSLFADTNSTTPLVLQIPTKTLAVLIGRCQLLTDTIHYYLLPSNHSETTAYGLLHTVDSKPAALFHCVSYNNEDYPINVSEALSHLPSINKGILI